MRISLRLIALCNVSRMPFYAVAKGRKPGIYNTWDECRAQVFQFSGPIFKKFSTQSEADTFIKQHSNSCPKTSTKSAVKGSDIGKKKQFLITRGVPSKTLKRTASTSSNNSEIIQPVKQRKINPEDKDDENNTNNIQENDSFIIDEDGYVNVYTDGACSSNGKSNPKAGIGVWFADNHKLNVSRAVCGRATNNMAEIQAVTVAALQAKKAGVKKLKINTDSQFLISCITKWMPHWKANRWKTASNKPVINKTELLEMEKAIGSLDVSWNHVNGHVGIHGNEMADKLARDGCSKY